MKEGECITVYQLRQKEVINCRDGMKLGFVCDVEIDITCGRVISFIIPGPCKICGILGREQEYIIPCACVKQIGTDVILVDVEIEKVIHKCG